MGHNSTLGTDHKEFSSHTASLDDRPVVITKAFAQREWGHLGLLRGEAESQNSPEVNKYAPSWWIVKWKTENSEN